MGNSPLVSYTRISPNSSNPRNLPIAKITPHHMAGNMTLESFGALVAQPSRQMSANYAIESSGRTGLFCEEKNRSWCSGNATNDNMAVTIEVANDTGAPNWHVSDKALAALIDLCEDICRRNGIPALKFTGDASGNLTQHNYFQATECPGPYLKSKFPYIEAEVNKRLGGAKGVQTMKVVDVYAGLTAAKTGGKPFNVQTFTKADVTAIAGNNLPDGRYWCNETGVALKGLSGYEGAQIVVNGKAVYVAIIPGATEYTTMTNAEAYNRFIKTAAPTGYTETEIQAVKAQLDTAHNKLADAQAEITAAQKALG